MRVTRHFVTVNGRRMHYTRAGSGPAIAILHASPASAKVLRPMQEIYATEFTALAFDTPGFGLSDLLPLEQPEIEDFADNLADTLTAMGIEQAATHGRHTGASIAAEFARRHPARCPLAVTDGFPVFSATQAKDRLSGYLKPIEPTWDGGHLIWLWYRFREQSVFWPWHAHSLANRADADPPSLDYQHRGVVELLEAGDGYRIGYAAAFRHAGLDILPDLKVPVCFGNRPGDSQFKTMAKYPPSAWIEEMPRDPIEAARAELAIFLKHPAKGEPPPAPATVPLPGRTTTDYVDLGDRQALVRSMGDLKAGVPILVLHHAPGSSALYDELVKAIGARRPVLAIDLPGHGESDPLPGGSQSIEDQAAGVLAVLDRLGIGAVQAYGHNAGAAVAVELARIARDRVQKLVLDAPICLAEREAADLAERYAPDVRPSWDGSHLIKMWHHFRDQELWWPWFDRRIQTARKTEPRIEPADLMIRVREVAKNPSSYQPAWRAAFVYPFRSRLARVAQPVALMTAAEDVFAHALDRARAVRTEAEVFTVADSASARAEAVLKALS